MKVSCQGFQSPAQNPNHALISLSSFAEPLLWIGWVQFFYNEKMIMGNSITQLEKLLSKVVT
jgi:hypothetical protein